MNKLIIISLLLVILLTLTSTSDIHQTDKIQIEVQQHQKPPLMGGWHQIPITSRGKYSRIDNYVRSMKVQLQTRSAKLEQVQRQVVAGFNYRFIYINREVGKRYHVIVFQAINEDQGLELRAFEQFDYAEEDEI